jgi:hypothetical protein
MMLYVQYLDNHYDYVNTRTLDRLIEEKRVRMFYRLSEARWVDVYHDPIRGSGGAYKGPDRRHPRMTPKQRIVLGNRIY